MDRFNALGRGLQIMLVAGVLLLIDSFFDWQAVDDFPGVSAWNNFLGVVMGLLTIVLIAWIVLKLAAVDIPLPVSEAVIAAALGLLTLAFAVLKNLTDDYSTVWSYIGVVLAAIIAFGAWQVIEAAGGMNTLRGEMPSRTAATAPPMEPAPMSTPPPATAPEPAPPPGEPASIPEPDTSADTEPAADDLDRRA